MADNRGLLYYPRWVNPSKILLGDISHRRDIIGSPWNSYIYDGNQWIPYSRGSKALQQKSKLRQQAQDFTHLVRKTGR